MLIHRYLSVFLFAVAGVAWAHEGVENPAVMERMHGMKEIAAHTKTLAEMVRGERSFDAGEAEAARLGLEAEARDVAALFEAPEDDPKSEARPVIWQDFAAFTVEADALVTAAERADVTSPEALSKAVAAIGQTCSSCHDVYRE